MPERAGDGISRRWAPGYRVDLRAALGPLRRGPADPALRMDPGGVWRVSLTPDGPVTLHVVRDGVGAMATAWGPGRVWAMEQLPALLGAEDEPDALDPSGHPLLEKAHAAHGELRLGKTGIVWEQLVPAIIEQRVTGKEARSSWRWICTRYGEPAPGPAPEGMRVPPSPEAVRAIPSWDWHKAAVDPGRSRAIVQCAPVASRFEGCTSAILDQRLQSRPGIGIWTSAEVRQRTHGDPDAISIGDYHLASFVGQVLVGEPVDDQEMVELLAPWAGQRQRVIRLLQLSVGTLERHGPRATITDHRGH